MRKPSVRRGFTLIEIMAALAAVSVLILAMGSTLIWLVRGEQQSIDANTSFNRVDMVRDLISTNLRAGRWIRFPTVDATTAYPADGGLGRGTVASPVQGEQLWLEVQQWDALTSTFFVENTLWFWDKNAEELRRIARVDATAKLPPFGPPSFVQTRILNFDVIRVSNRRVRFIISSIEADQPAETEFTVTMRNVP